MDYDSEVPVDSEVPSHLPPFLVLLLLFLWGWGLQDESFIISRTNIIDMWLRFLMSV
jgi:hypothetical protein